MTETISMRYRRPAAAQGEVSYTPAMAMPLEMLYFYYETVALAHQNQIQLMLGKATPAYNIYLSMPEPSHFRRYLSLAPARFHFDDQALPGVRVVMGADLLDMPLPFADPRVVQQVDERCGALGQKPPVGEHNGWGDYVAMMLREAGNEMVTLDELARRLHVSARTIDRHLKKENLQFRDLSQQVRFERARELLSVPGATVSQVAHALGFSDSANFSRAFRRAVDLSPSQYQQALRANAPSSNAAP
jgi:AraC-like DNA-binding protein